MPPAAAAGVAAACRRAHGSRHAALPGGRVMARRPALRPIALRAASAGRGACRYCCARRRWPPCRRRSRARAQRQIVDLSATVRSRPISPDSELGAGQSGLSEQMLVRADEINYDYTNERVAAVGNVQIYYARLDARSRPGHLRPEDQAPARGRQRPADRGRRQDHLRRDHRSERRLPRRLRRFAAARQRRPDPLRRHPRRAHAAAISRSSRAASTPPASPARTIPRSRRSGRSRRPGSSTIRARR